MRIPFVIDNQQHTMSDVLSGLLMEQRGQSPRLATAYFNVGGWQLLQRGLEQLGTFRLLLGDEPEVGADIGIRDQFEEGREEALVGIFKSRYLKRFESSIDAFRISVRRALEFLGTFESYILDGKVVEEQESFVELVSSEFLLQNLKGLLDNEMQQMLEEVTEKLIKVRREQQQGILITGPDQTAAQFLLA